MDNDFPVGLEQIRLRRDLLREGWTDRDIWRAVISGVLTKIRHGAYVDTHLTSGLDEVGWSRLRSRAVLRTGHISAALSHQSALAEHGLPLWGLNLNEVHLTRTDAKPGRREAGVVHHRGRLSQEDLVTRSGMAMVTAARAAVELVLASRVEVGLVVLCSVLHAQLATLDAIHDVAQRAERWPNSLHARLVLARADARITNVAEARVWHLFFDQSIPRPEPQAEVRTATGVLLGIVDFLWRRQGVFLEFDGRLKYEQHRRPGETLDEYLMREKRREEAICAATGWVCIRLGWADLSRPISTGRRIKQLLDSRRDPAA